MGVQPLLYNNNNIDLLPHITPHSTITGTCFDTSAYQLLRACCA